MESELLIPGLPDDVSYECLARVSSSFEHSPAVRRVCRRWKRVVDSAELRRVRESSGLTRPLVVIAQAEPLPAPTHKKHTAAISVGPYRLVAYNPESSAWAPIPPPPPCAAGGGGLPLFCGLAAASGELVVVGGWDPHTWAASDEVFVYSFASGTWRRGAPVPGPRRSFFACGAVAELNGRSGMVVVVAGGHDEEKNALRSAAAYDVGRDEWVPLPDMTRERDECRAVCLAGGRLLRIQGGYSTEAQGLFHDSSETLDLTTGTWGAVEDMPDADAYAAVSGAGDTIYRFQKSGEVMEEVARWRREVPEDARVGTKAVACGDKIMVVGSANHGGDLGAYILDAAAAEGKGLEWMAVDVPPEYSGHVQAICCLEI